MTEFKIVSLAIFMLIIICACSISLTSVRTDGSSNDVTVEDNVPSERVQVPLGND